MRGQTAILSVLVGVLCFGSAVLAGPQVLEVSPRYMEFTGYEGGANPAAQVVSIWNSGPGPAMDWMVTEDCNWITVEPNSGASSGEVDDANVIADINGLSVGTYNCQLTVTGSGAPNSPQIVDVNLVVLYPEGLLVVPLEYPTIQAGIDAAVDGNTVIVLPGTYTGSGNRDIDFLGKAITVRSTDPEDPCVVAETVIDCENGKGRGFYFHSGEGPNSVIYGLTIMNGWAWNKNGGGILCQNSSPKIRNCIIKNNAAELAGIGGGFGGGIYCEGSSADILNCTITNNTCTDSGGGILIFSGAPTVTDCLINGNSGSWGGGIGCIGDSALITNCVITENDADRIGGGISCEEDSNALIYNCTIKGNTGNLQNSRGGGIACTGSSPTIINCLITGCSADSSGGGIYCADNSDPVIRNCTIVDNHANGRGGGIYCYWSDPNMTNCVLWANTTDWVGPQIAIRTSGWPSSLTVSFTDVEGGQGDAYVESGCTLNWGPGNIDTDPCFVDPCNGDYHLQSEAGRWDANSESWVIDASTSPCIDAGNPGCPLGDEPNDVNNVRINMGAYGGTAEASKSPANWRNIADMTNDGAVDGSDLSVFVDWWVQSGECIPSDLDRSQSADFVDFDILGENWLWGK